MPRHWGPPAPLADRLWSKVEVSPSGCWLFTGVTVRGYGQIWVDESARARRAHRVAWQLIHGAIPAGLQVEHACHTNDPTCVAGNDCLHRRCINPEHLELLTGAQNTARAHNYAPPKSHCPRGHELGGANLYVNPNSGDRACKRCRADSEKRRRGAESTRQN